MTEKTTAFDILDFYALSGIDEVVGDTPVDRFAVSAAPPQQVRTAVVPPSSPSAVSATVPLPASVSGIQSLAELREKLEHFDGCPLKQTAQHTVFGAGNPKAKLMIIGEAPGAEEDKQGLPFVGASGHLLDLMLASVGLSRDSVYITNVVPWRPPMNRKPSEAEIAACLPFLRRHITLVEPKVILLLGGIALTALLHITDGITKTRGFWMTYEDDETHRSFPVMASFHPAYLLRSPAQKKSVWRDLQNVRDKLNA